MNKKQELIAYKHSALIQTNAKNLTLVQRKIINSLIYIAQKSGDLKKYSIKTTDLKKSCGISSVGNDELKKNLIGLTEINIEFNYLKKDKTKGWQIMVLLAGAEMVSDSNEVLFAFSPFLQEKILNPNMYAPLKILMIASLKNRYSIVLYELLRDYKDSPKGFPKLEIEEFKNLMGVKGNKYERFYNFKTKVINIAVDEINKKTDIKCSYKLFKEKGNKYSHIKFKIESIQEIKEVKEKKQINSKKKIENKDQLTKQLDEIELKISKEFSISDKLILEWIDKFGKEKINEIYEYTRSMKPKKPAGYMRRIIESGVDLDNISVITKKEKARRLKAEATNCMMRYVVEEKNCGKYIEDAQDPKDKCYYCIFKNNGDLKKIEDVKRNKKRVGISL